MGEGQGEPAGGNRHPAERVRRPRFQADSGEEVDRIFREATDLLKGRF